MRMSHTVGVGVFKQTGNVRGEEKEDFFSFVN